MLDTPCFIIPIYINILEKYLILWLLVPAVLTQQLSSGLTLETALEHGVVAQEGGLRVLPLTWRKRLRTLGQWTHGHKNTGMGDILKSALTTSLPKNPVCWSQQVVS